MSELDAPMGLIKDKTSEQNKNRPTRKSLFCNTKVHTLPNRKILCLDQAIEFAGVLLSFYLGLSTLSNVLNYEDVCLSSANMNIFNPLPKSDYYMQIVSECRVSV